MSPASLGVLVVEDDPDLQWRLARLMHIDGSRVVGTSSGDGALALIAEWPVDLVFVAEGLPGMGGLEVVRRIREAYPAIRVVLMSHDETPEMHEAAERAGAARCVSKPPSAETVRSIFKTTGLVPALAVAGG